MRHILNTEHAGGWTPERVAKLRQLWDDGYTAAAIAIELGDGLTRSGVCGKVKRLHLSPRKGTVRIPMGMPAGTRARRKPKVRMAPPPRSAFRQADSTNDAIELVWPLMVGLIDLTEQTCKYPVGEPLERGFGFCGHPSKEGSPYCEAHHRACYRLPSEKAKVAGESVTVALEVAATNPHDSGCVAAGLTSPAKSTPLATSPSPSI